MILELQAQGVQIVLSGVNKSVMKDLSEHHISGLIGEENMLDNFNKAVKRSIEKLNASGAH